MKEDYEKVKKMIDDRRKALKYTRSIGEAIQLRELKKKYGLHSRTSAKLLLYTIRTKLGRDEQKNVS